MKSNRAMYVLMENLCKPKIFDELECTNNGMVHLVLHLHGIAPTFLILDLLSRTANMDLLKMVPVEILLNFGNYFRTLQLGFWKFISGIVFLHHYVRTIGLFFSQAHSIWPKPRAFNPDRKSMGTPTFYCARGGFIPITSTKVINQLKK